MAKRQEDEGPRRIWRDVLATLVGRKEKEFTAADVTGWTGMEYPGAAQVLKRLQTWGHIRLIGFDPAANGRGRRRKVYEVTDHGRRSAAYHEAKR